MVIQKKNSEFNRNKDDHGSYITHHKHLSWLHKPGAQKKKSKLDSEELPER